VADLVSDWVLSVIKPDWPWFPLPCTPAWLYGARTWSRFLANCPNLQSANYRLFFSRQRYGMRERLVNRDLEEEAGGADEGDYHVYAPTTKPATPRA